MYRFLRSRISQREVLCLDDTDIQCGVTGAAEVSRYSGLDICALLHLNIAQQLAVDLVESRHSQENGGSISY